MTAAIGAVQTNLNITSNTLAAAIAAEVLERMAGDSNLTAAIAAEAVARGAAETNLTAAIGQVQTNLNISSNAAAAALAAEAGARGAGETNLTAAIGAVQTNLNISSNAAAAALAAVQTNVDLLDIELQEAKDSWVGGVTNKVMDIAGKLWTITNAPASLGDVLKFTPANTTAYFAAETAAFYRYDAYPDAANTIWVFATATNITAARAGSTFTFTIPAGTRLMSAKIRVDGGHTDSGKIYLAMGTNDMLNSSTVNNWIPVCNATRDDTFANVPVTAQTYSGDNSLIVISGLGSVGGITYHVELRY